jgi:hypothetical protein
MHAERVDFRSVGIPKTRTAETASRVLLQRAVTISKIKSTPQSADDIVIGLFAPLLSVCNGYETGVAHLGKNKMADPWAPNPIDYLSI